MQCSNCNAEVSDSAKFCESCGFKLSSACPACGSTGNPDRKFCSECGTRIAPAEEEVPTPADPNSAISGAPERRHLTVMFCDLVGSTDMAAQVDAEDFSDIIRLYNETAKSVIQRYDGYIARYVGDGLLSYFGYPQAMEDSAERSVHAGLELIQEVKKLKPPIDVSLQTRVGIASGEVIAGETVLGDAYTETLAIGSTPNLAARLQSLAEPDTVYVADSTQRLIRMGIEWEDKGSHQLKGFDRPRQVWHALGQSVSTVLDIDDSSRFGGYAIFGRDQELQQIFSSYERAKVGDVQVIQLVGEGGIGKSAMVKAIRRQLKNEEHDEAIMHCSNLATDTPLFPLKQCLEYISEIRPSDDDGTKFAKLSRMFQESESMDPLSVACVAKLIGIDLEDSQEQDNLSPRQQYSQAIDAITNWVDEQAKKRTLVLIIEDAHWIDPSTLDWINNLVETRKKGRIMLLVTSRPTFTAPWDIGENVDILNVKRLGSDSCAEIINRIAGDEGLPQDLLDSLLTKTEGIPLFVEELTSSILDSARNADNELNQSFDDIVVPDSLRDSLMARLDRTPWIREIVQFASVIGREFTTSLLCAVCQKDAATVESGLLQMEEAGVLRKRQGHAELIWVFKHALLRDAAYESILRSTRKKIHSTVADCLIQQKAAVIDNHPEVLAKHFSAAGRSNEAIKQWQQAAKRAAANWSNAEASQHLQLAVDELSLLEENEERRLRELQLLLDLGHLQRAAFGSGSAQAFATLQRAVALSRENDDVETTLKIREAEFIAYYGSARLAECIPAAKELLRIGELYNDEACIIAGHQCNGMQKFSVGDMEQARHHLEAALSHGDKWPVDDVDVQFPTAAEAYLSWTLHMLGESDKAVQVSEVSIAKSESGVAYSHALSLANACYLHQFRGDTKRVKEIAGRALEFVAGKDLLLWRDISDFFMRWAICADDPSPEHANNFCDALGLWAEDEIETPYFKTIAGEACILAGLTDKGIELLQQADDLMQHTGEIWYQDQLKKIKQSVGLT